MKKGWQEKSVGDILQLEYGKPLDEADRKPDGRYPVYGANGEKDRTDKFYHDKPSIIVGRKGSAGEVNLTEKQFWPLDVTYFVTFDEKQHDLRFLYYLLTTLELTKLAKGVKPGINRNEVYSQTTRVPPLAEQQRIVGLLDEAFEGLATAKAKAEKNLQNARALFESHLQSVFTQRGAGWKQKTLEEIATTFGRGKSKHRPRNEPKLYGGKYPFVQTGDIRNADHFIGVFPDLQRPRTRPEQALAKGDNLHHHRGEHRRDSYLGLRCLLPRQHHWRRRKSERGRSRLHRIPASVI